MKDRDVAPVRRSPEPDSPIRASRGDRLSVGAIRRGHDFPGVTIVGRFDLTASRGIPLADGPIRRRRHEAPAIRSERDAEHLASVPSKLSGHLAGRCVPETCQAIFAGGGEARAVRAENQGPRVTDVLGSGRPWLARIRVVEREAPNFMSSPDHCQPRTVRAGDHQVGFVRFGRAIQLGLDAPFVVQESQDVCGLVWSLCDSWVRGHALPVPAQEPQSVPRQLREQRERFPKRVSGP